MFFDRPILTGATTEPGGSALIYILEKGVTHCLIKLEDAENGC